MTTAQLLRVFLITMFLLPRALAQTSASGTSDASSDGLAEAGDFGAENPETRKMEERRQELLSHAQRLLREGREDEAIPLAEDARTLEAKLFEETYQDYSPTLRWLTLRYVAKNNIELARQRATEMVQCVQERRGYTSFEALSAEGVLDYVKRLSEAAAEQRSELIAVEAEILQQLRQKEYTTAATRVQKLISIETLLLGTDHLYFAAWLERLHDLTDADVFGGFIAAVDLNRLAHNREVGSADPESIALAIAVARARIVQQMPSRAVRPLRDAVAGAQQLNKDRDAAVIGLQLAQVHSSLKQLREARQVWLAGLKTFRDRKETQKVEFIQEQLTALLSPMEQMALEARGATIEDYVDLTPAAILHLIIVADTSDPGIGVSVLRDLENIDFCFRNQVPSIMLRETILQGGDVSPEQILSSVNAAEVRAEQDTLVVYYAGHGSYDLQQEDHILETTQGQLSRATLLRQMKQKQPRLTVVITDACGSFRKIRGAYMAPFPMGQLSPLFHSLFFYPQGVVDICAAGRGEVALGTTNGGLFTNALTQFFMEHENESATWNEIVAAVNENVAATPKASKLQPRQTAEELSQPEYPKFRGRLGVVADRTKTSAEHSGVEVVTVQPGSPATRLKDADGGNHLLRSGLDVITHVNDSPVRSNQEFVQAVAAVKGNRITLTIVDLTTGTRSDYFTTF